MVVRLICTITSPFLQPDLVADAFARPYDQGALGAPQRAFGAHRRGERHEFEFAEHGDARSAHLGKIGDGHRDGEVALATADHQWDRLTDAHVEAFGFPVEGIAQRSAARS